ncbi:hypothetical protein CEXT_327471, partial [Caerostris extrusa]
HHGHHHKSYIMWPSPSWTCSSASSTGHSHHGHHHV